MSDREFCFPAITERFGALISGKAPLLGEVLFSWNLIGTLAGAWHGTHYQNQTVNNTSAKQYLKIK